MKTKQKRREGGTTKVNGKVQEREEEQLRKSDVVQVDPP
jgi:hypothetical protein